MKFHAMAFAALTAFAGVLAPASAAQQLARPSSSQAPAVHPDLIYHQVAPCRVFDTEPAGRIVAGKSRAFQIVGATGFEQQGGPVDGCGVPAYATMVTLSLTAHRGARSGFAAAGATADTRTKSISFQASHGTTSGVTAILNQGKLTVSTSATAHFTGDVTGYFAPQLWAMSRPDGQLYMSSGRFLSSRRLSVGVYEVTADRDIHICGAVASVALQNYYATAITDLPVKPYVTVRVFDPAGQPADAPFTVMVKC